MTVSEARIIATWRAPLEGEITSEELLLSFDRARDRRVLVLPALFDEANKMRRFTVQTMRALDANGVDCFLPDLPGCNESLVRLEDQTLDSWRVAVADAVEAFSITHVLAIRGGALLAPATLSAWQYAPQSGAKILRGLIRARTIASKEAGREESAEQLLEEGRKQGLALAGWPIGAAMLREFERAEPVSAESHTIIAHKDIGSAALWLRAEPGEDDAGAEALAALISGAGDAT